MDLHNDDSGLKLITTSGQFWVWEIEKGLFKYDTLLNCMDQFVLHHFMLIVNKYISVLCQHCDAAVRDTATKHKRSCWRSYLTPCSEWPDKNPESTDWSIELQILLFDLSNVYIYDTLLSWTPTLLGCFPVLCCIVRVLVCMLRKMTMSLWTSWSWLWWRD